MRSQLIKENKLKQKKLVDLFLELREDNISYDVNKTVEESQTLRKCTQTEDVLPSIEDIRKVTVYIRDTRDTSLASLKESFSHRSYKSLSESTLLDVMTFNRKRAGDIERITLDNLKTKYSITEEDNPDLYGKLSAESKETVAKYVRYSMRGKKGKVVPCVVTREMQECIDYLKDAENRRSFGLTEENPYLFGEPSKDVLRPKFVKATKILPKYAEKSGVTNHKKIRGTFLRKHLATFCSAELSDQDISTLAKFMGHKDSTRRDFYRLPDKLKDLLEISQYLEKAQGNIPDETKIFDDDDIPSQASK